MSTVLLNLPHPELRQPKLAGQLPENLVNIGLTGGIGSGKSTVAKMWQARGAALVDLDAISHALTQAHGRAMSAIVAAFGAQAMIPSGALNRAQMRAWIFEDVQAKKTLEGILHPMIAQDALAMAHQLAQKTSLKCLVYEIPLLVGSEFWLDRLDWVVVVECTRATQVERVKKRSPDLSVATIESMIDAQPSAEQRRKIANALINNDKNQAGHLNIAFQMDILSQHSVLLHKNVGLIRK